MLNLQAEIEALTAPGLAAINLATSALSAVKDSEIAAIQKTRSPSPVLKLVLEVSHKNDKSSGNVSAVSTTSTLETSVAKAVWMTLQAPQ